MLHNQILKSLFQTYKESNLQGRYINNTHIIPLLNTLSKRVTIKQIGKSVLHKPIYGITFGKGSKRVLMWSQMHGNESTTTKAVFDLINTLITYKDQNLDHILKNCTITIIPILNPDGAEQYTRVNASEVDLNRDAQVISQPETKVLLDIFYSFKPHYCFNLHDQRTIYNAGKVNKPATVSFLSPAQDEERALTENRKKAMEIIVEMNKVLQKQIPGQVGRYDDSFNINCVGDTFQNLSVPTILFEAGHFSEDYQRERTREYIFQSLITALYFISESEVNGTNYESYFKIPENEKLYFDILLRDALLDGELVDIAIQFEEVLVGGKIEFFPILSQVGNLTSHFGHREILVDKNEVKIHKNEKNVVFEIVIVKKNSQISTINLM